MRALLVILLILATGKVWLKSETYKAAAEEALLAAYRIHAEVACNERPQTDMRGMPLAVGAVDWKKSSQAEIIIGNPRLNVSLWEINNPFWKARYKNPFLMLKVKDRQGMLTCTYDILQGATELSSS